MVLNNIKHHTLQLKNNVEPPQVRGTIHNDAQLMYHKQLREHVWMHNNNNITYDTSDWRHVRILTDTRDLEGRKEGLPEDELRLSNCHLLQWSTEIAIGTPTPQVFSVAVDTSSPTLWVVSSKCEDEPCANIQNGRFDEEQSRSYRFFDALEFEEPHVAGEYGFDYIYLGGIKLKNQVFAQVTSFTENHDFCENIDGVMGLNAMNNYKPKVLPFIAGLIQNSVFMYSLFLCDIDDFDSPDSNQLTEDFSIHPHSQLILGGVDQRRYAGCLKWFRSKESSDRKYWNFKLDDVLLGESSLSSTATFAIVDSRSSNIIGPTDAIAEFAKANGISCFILNSEGNIESDVDCYDEKGFDVMIVDCDEEDEQEFVPLTFAADGMFFEFDIHDLSRHDIDEVTNKQICIPRLVASSTMDDWVMGAPFLTKFYSAYDLEKHLVGFAPASTVDEPICDNDVDITISMAIEPGLVGPADSHDVDDVPETDDGSTMGDDAYNRDDASSLDDLFGTDEAAAIDDGVIDSPDEDNNSNLNDEKDDSILFDSSNPSDTGAHGSVSLMSQSDVEGAQEASKVFMTGAIGAFLIIGLYIIFNIMRRRRINRQRLQFAQLELGEMTSEIGLFRINDEMEIM